MGRWSAESAWSLNNRTRRSRLRRGPDIGRRFRYNISKLQKDGFALIVVGRACVPEQLDPVSVAYLSWYDLLGGVPDGYLRR